MEGFFFLLKWLKVGNYDFRMKMERVLWIWFYHIRVIFAKYFSIILINLRFAKRVNMPEITVQWKYWLRIREPGKIPIGGSTSVIYTSRKLFHSNPQPPKKKSWFAIHPITVHICHVQYTKYCLQTQTPYVICISCYEKNYSHLKM